MISVEAMFRQGDADRVAVDCTGCAKPSVVMLLIENKPAIDAAARSAMAAAATEEAKIEVIFAGMRAGNDPVHLCQDCVDKLAAGFAMFATRPRRRIRAR